MTERPAQVMAPVVLRFLARVAVADGVIDPSEIEVLVYVAATMGLAEADARRVLDDELATRSDAELLARQLPDPAHLRSVFGLGCMMALAEGQVARSEQQVLDAFARGAGLSATEAREILDEIAAQMV
jgi:tellurite resistance protein